MKKVFGIFAVIALAVVVSVNVSMNSRDEDLSDLALANIEALASGESGSGLTVMCWYSLTGDDLSVIHTEKTYCTTCSAIPATAWYTEGHCRK